MSWVLVVLVLMPDGNWDSLVRREQFNSKAACEDQWKLDAPGFRLQYERVRHVCVDV